MTGTKKSARLFAVAGIAALALSACGTTGGNSDNASGDSTTGGGSGCNPLKIAFLGAATGPNGALGQNMIGGVNTALADYNAAHSDCKVTLKVADSQGDPAKATPLATDLINDQSIIGVVGPGFSGESDATGAAFNEAGLTTISPSATNVSLTTKGWKTFHRVLANDGAQGPAAAKYLTGTAGAKKVFVIDDSEDYGTGLADSVKKALGGALGGTDSVQQGQTDFSGSVAKVKASGADAVFYGGYYAESALLVKQLRQAGWKGTFESGDGSEDPSFVKIAGAQAAEGSILTAAAAPASADFTKKFEAANPGKEPGLYSAEGYDAAKVFLDGIDAGKTTRSAMLDFVSSYDAQGVTKQIKFTPTGEVETQTIYAYVVKGGKIQPGQPIQ